MAQTQLLVPAETVIEIRRRCTDKGLPDPGSICIARALAFWESVSPGNGLRITENLEELYALGTRMPLSAPSSGLAVAVESLAWLGVHQHVTVANLGDARRSIGMELGEVTGVPLKVQLSRKVQDELNDVVGTWLAVRLPELVWDTLEHRLSVGIERHFPEDQRSAAYALVHDALNATITFSVSNLIAGRDDESRPLLDMWLSGNWPIGCTADGALVVFAGSPDREAVPAGPA